MKTFRRSPSVCVERYHFRSFMRNCLLQKFIREALLKPVDVLVATPSSLLKYRQQERILLSDVSHLVLDEADTLLDRSFLDATASIIRAIKLRTQKPPKYPAKAENAQVTVVGATLSDHVIEAVEKLVPVSSLDPGVGVM